MKTAISSEIKIRKLNAQELRQINKILDGVANAKRCFVTQDKLDVVATNIDTARLLVQLVSKIKKLNVGKIQRYLNKQNQQFLYGFTVTMKS